MLFSDYLKGMIKYKVKTDNPETLINGLRESASPKNIQIIENNCVSFFCYHDEKFFVEDLVYKNGFTIESKKEVGMIRIRNAIKPRLGLVAGFFVSVVLVFASTFFVWDIRIIGNENLTDWQVAEMLDEAGFHEGVLKRNVDVKSVVNRVLINCDELSWLAINFEGTVANVEVKEASNPKRHIKKENVNIVASHNGIVMRVDALDGESQVMQGDAVFKGQLLISSFVEKRTGGSILKGAKGFVWAKTERNVCVIVPLEYCEKEYTGRERVSYSFSFLGKKVNFPLSTNKRFSNSCAEMERLNLTMSEKLVLPFEAEKYLVREYENYKKRRTQREAVKIAQKAAKEKLEESSPEFKCADIKETYGVEGNNLVYMCTFEGVENIAKELEFELS